MLYIYSMSNEQTTPTMSNGINIKKNLSGNYVATKEGRKIRFEKGLTWWVATERIGNRKVTAYGFGTLEQTISRAFDKTRKFWKIPDRLDAETSEEIVLKIQARQARRKFERS